MNEPLIIYKSKRKAVFIILAGFLLLGASVLSFVYANDHAFGWMFIITAAMVFIVGMSGFTDRKPQLILTEKGITELYAIREEIEWDAIVHVDDFFYRGQDVVRLLLPRNYKPDLLRPTWFWRLDRIYSGSGFKAMYIRVSGLAINSKQLASIITGMVKESPDNRNGYLQSVKGRF